MSWEIGKEGGEGEEDGRKQADRQTAARTSQSRTTNNGSNSGDGPIIMHSLVRHQLEHLKERRPFSEMEEEPLTGALWKMVAGKSVSVVESHLKKRASSRLVSTISKLHSPSPRRGNEDV